MLGAMTALALASTVATGATGNTTVSVTVASATNMSTASCATGTANITDFGTVLPSTSNITSSDCTVVFGSSNDTAMLRVFQRDGLGKALWRPARGPLDASFGSGGTTVVDIASGVDFANDAVVQPNGAIILAGQGLEATWEFTIARLTSAGVLDPSFSIDGKHVQPIGAAADSGYAVALHADGRIVQVGNAALATSDIALVQYNADGTLDTGFDGDSGTGNGIVTTDIAGAGEVAYDVAIQADGKIVVAGYSNASLLVARYLIDGRLDTTFDGDGISTLGLTGIAYAVAVQPDGKIVAAGTNAGDFKVVRYASNGGLDLTFGGGDGIAMIDVNSGSSDTARSMVMQDDGRIVAGGVSSTAGNDDFAVARLTSLGDLDASFAGDGTTTTPIGVDDDIGYGVTVQQDGMIVLTGETLTGAVRDTPVVRYTTDGTLDSTFDGDGIRIFSFGPINETGQEVLTHLDGRLLVTSDNGGNAIIARLDTTRVEDYTTPGADWSSGTDSFGACLHTVVGGATGAWPVAGTGNCTTGLLTNWNPIVATSGTTGSKIALSSSAGTQTAQANLRFGFRSASNQPPGTYQAPVVFEVAAPNV